MTLLNEIVRVLLLISIIITGDCGNPPGGFGEWDAPLTTSNSVDQGRSASSSTGNRGTADDDQDNDDDVWQLFDLTVDPEERHDLLSSAASAAPVHFEAAQAMRRALEAHGAMTQPALSWVTKGDARASPHLHEGRWVNWLDEPQGDSAL